jgi:hypothetical protein
MICMIFSSQECHLRRGALTIMGDSAQTRVSTEVREELSAIPIDAPIKSGPSKTWEKKRAVEAISNME